MARTYKFQTQARELLDLMVYSVYSNKDIFLRELISNASDALDKLRLESMRNDDLKPLVGAPEIHLSADSKGRTLSVSDNGIGMNEEDLKAFLGTIAKSGSREFVNLLKEAKGSQEQAELIGQFGVGFYSSFMVADRVVVETKKAGEEQAWTWESTGDGTYLLGKGERGEHGTTVTLHLKDVDDESGIRDFTQEWVLREIVGKYSDFVPHPIILPIERQEMAKDEEGNPMEDGEPVTVVKAETLNSMKAIWTRPEKDVTEEEFNDFYKHLTHDFQDPMLRISSKAEGMSEHRMLLFVPTKAPYDLFYREAEHGVDLYIRRVFIMHDCKELLPFYLRFIKGVVDSEDLPLNISREILQQDRHISIIRKNVIRKVLGALKTTLEEDRKKYETFWAQFGPVFKEGLFQDHANNKDLLPLVLFDSTHSATEKTTLAEYIERMKEGQEAIYYLTGKNRQAIESSPHLESFKARGIEVLLLSDAVDELWVPSVHEFQEKPLSSVGKGTVDLGSEEEKKKEEEELKEKQTQFKSLLEFLQKTLDDRVKEVRFSTRLTESPSCLVGETYDMTPQLEQMMKAMGQDVPVAKRILELNPSHPILEHLEKRYQANAEDPDLSDAAELLFGQAVLAEGGQLPDPGEFARRLSKWMLKAMEG